VETDMEEVIYENGEADSNSDSGAASNEGEPEDASE